MFIASTRNSRKIVHKPTCCYLKMIAPDKQIEFTSLDDAQKAGYRLCDCCTRMGKHYYREKFQVDRFCKEHGFRHLLHNGSLYIVSGEETVWRIVPGGKNKKAFFLQHENLFGTRYVRREQPYWRRAFHKQKVRRDRIVDYLEYILDHDAYIQAQTVPQRTQSPKPKQPNPHSARQRRKGVVRTLSLIESLTPDYHVPKAAQRLFQGGL